MNKKANKVNSLLQQYEQLMDYGNYEEAFELLRETKETQPFVYHRKMGDAYEFGNGKSIDYEKSVEHYLKAVNSGDESSLSYVANVYRKMKQYDQSLKYLQKGAKCKQMLSLFLLGNFYEFGKGVKPNIKKAQYFYHLASKQGHIYSRVRMIMFMCTGELGFIKRICGILMVPFAFFEFCFYWVFKPETEKFSGAM